MLMSGGLGTIPGWVTTDNGVEWAPGTSGGAPAPDGLHVVDFAYLDAVATGAVVAEQESSWGGVKALYR